MQWTEAQRKTIELRDKNILVSAAAGSGKTAVLIERIKQLVIKEKTDIDRFLITTFTNAASAEMKERLEKAVRKELEECREDKDKRAFLRKQLELIPRANIGTFHNFALEIIHRYFYLTDLEPGFKIGDEVQVSILKRESVDHLFEERFNEDYESFKDFLRKYSGDRNENRIKNNIISIYDELRSIPEYMSWAESKTEFLKSESPSEALGLTDFIAKEVEENLSKVAVLYAEAADIIDEAGVDSLSEKARQDAENVKNVLDNFRDFMRISEGSADIENLEKVARTLGALNFNVMRAAKAQQEDYEIVKEKVTECRKKGKKIIDDLLKKYFARSFDEYDKEMRQLYGDTRYFIELVGDFEKIFKGKKQEKNIVDFDDIMHYAIDILKDPMAAGEYREQFTYIFIDEFQDSNMLQEMIVEKIAGKNNLFMVGDVKQSIYKFRLAEPEIFKKKYDLYRQESENHSEKIDLNNNFRSKLNVTETVNNVFCNIMEDYDENAMLHCTVDSDNKGGRSHLTIIDSSRDDSNIREKGLKEAETVAKIIRENLGKDIYDVKKGIMRPVEYKDIVVLSRSRSVISDMERYLNNSGIPAFGENSGGYFESVEIQVFVNLLKVIDNKRRDIPLISVMNSVIFNFDITELARIRISYREGSFYQAVKNYGEDGEDVGIRNKIRGMMEKISYWKAMSRTVTLEELVRILLYETGYYDYCSGLPVGKQRVSNLRMLVEKAVVFEEKNYSGLYGFLAYIEAMKQNNLSVGEARTVGENDNVVRIMTVHKSKGLEFPVVILTGTGRTIRFKGIGSSASMHKDLTLGLPMVNRTECWHRKTLLQRVIDGKKAKEELEEEVRILYVALTRAMDRLELVGTVKDAEKLDRYIFKGKSYIEMVYGAFKDSDDCITVIYAGDDETESSDVYREKRTIGDIIMKIRENENDEKYAEVDDRLSYEYRDDRPEISVKSKYSVTELNNVDEKREKALSMIKPEFVSESCGEKKLSAAEAGTVMHLVMEKLDFGKAAQGGLTYIKESVKLLKDKGFLTDEEIGEVNYDSILSFLNSPIGRRAAGADYIQKEREFILLKNINGADTIVQGIIDCYFEDKEGLVIVDYKNINLKKDMSEEDVKAKYKKQLELYREALSEAEGREVTETYLYLFKQKKFIKEQ